MRCIDGNRMCYGNYSNATSSSSWSEITLQRVAKTSRSKLALWTKKIGSVKERLCTEDVQHSLTACTAYLEESAMLVANRQMNRQPSLLALNKQRRFPGIANLHRTRADSNLWRQTT